MNIPEDIKKKIEQNFDETIKVRICFLHQQQRSYIKHYCIETGEFAYSLAQQEIERLKGLIDVAWKESKYILSDINQFKTLNNL